MSALVRNIVTVAIIVIALVLAINVALALLRVLFTVVVVAGIAYLIWSNVRRRN